MTIRLGVEAWGTSGDLQFTGMGQYAVKLLRHLSAYPSEFSVVAYAGPGEPRPAWLPARTAWRPVGPSLPAKLTALYSRGVALRSAVHADRLDLFHATGVHMRPLFPPVPALHCRVVVTLHDLIPQTYYAIAQLPFRQRVFYRWNVRRALNAEAIIAVSQSAHDDIIRHSRDVAPRLIVIHNAIDFPPNPDPQPLDRIGLHQPYVLYAGSYEPRKNLIGALRSFAMLINDAPSHQLVAVVERSSGHAAAAIQVLNQLNLADRVRLVHSLPEADLRALYTHASALFFPSFAEGFGYPPLQAAACGVPVVASDLKVLHETLGDAAIYIDPHDNRSMADGLRVVLKDEHRRGELVTAGLQRARLYDPRRWISRHADIYRQLGQGTARVRAVNPIRHSVGGSNR